MLAIPTGAEEHRDHRDHRDSIALAGDLRAYSILQEAQVSGLNIELDGDALVWRSEAQPSASLLDVLMREKPAILRVLSRYVNRWNSQSWREFFEERAGIAEFSGGLPRFEAEAMAYRCCIGEWLNQNPVRSPSGSCCWCGEGAGVLQPYVTDLTTGNPGHTWLHQECSRAWHQSRRQLASAALELVGIKNPQPSSRAKEGSDS